MKQMFWTFQEDTPYHYFEKLKKYTLDGQIDKITAEILVLNSIDDRVAGSYRQAKIMYNALKTQKTYHEFTTALGAQFHCQLGAPPHSGEIILNRLDGRLMRE